MAKYLIEARYTSEGMKGLIAKGGTSRRQALERMAAEVGGKVETFNFAFGGADVYVQLELPNNVSAAALGLIVGASGMVSCKTVVLLTPEELDKASAMRPTYTPPGH
jgi:uncharacterized protein with GYD domain